MTDEPSKTGEPRPDGDQGTPAALAIVAGRPTAAEAAAVTVVLAALASAAGARPQPGPGGPRSAWSDPSRRLRPAVSAGPGAWRASGLPA
jgi:Acyl-CoA carboxylase epsilon subunit